MNRAARYPAFQAIHSLYAVIHNVRLAVSSHYFIPHNLMYLAHYTHIDAIYELRETGTLTDGMWPAIHAVIIRHPKHLTGTVL